MENLPHDFKEFLRLLSDNGVSYLIVGGHAVTFHGYPRYTGDIDVFVEMDPANAEKIVISLKEFGFDLPGLRPELFLDHDRMTQLGREPVKIEILNSISGITFDEASQDAETVIIDGVNVPVISLAMLRKNKQAAGRLKDLADLENLPEVKAE